MSGFAALLYPDERPVDPAVFERMLDPLRTRGPDGARVWTERNIGLGLAVLHNSPESLKEPQPFRTRDGNYVIAGDIRLDNRAELLNELKRELAGQDPGDAAFLAVAYGRWGADCVDHLLGDFAFVIWDAAERRLFGARDHFGVRPFYYTARAGQMFACASDPAAILQVPQVCREINESRIADFLVSSLEGSDKTSTFYRDIFRLPPGHTVTVDRNGLRVRTYWTTDVTREIRFAKDEEYTEAFRDIFGEAVRCRLRTADRAAVMLSGGLDSAAVAAFAREDQSGVRTYSCLLRERSACVETPFVEAFIGSGGLEPKFIYDDDLCDSDELIDRHFSDPSDIFATADIPLIIYDAARRDGIRVVLDGVDGDVVASANLVYLNEFARTGSPREFFSQASGYARYYGLTGRESVGLIWDQGVKALLRAHLPARLRRRTGPLHTLDWDDPVLSDSLIDREFARRIGLAEKWAGFNADTGWGDRPARENDAQTLNSPMITAALERYDRTAASCSVEARHPFFDKRVVDFCLALPLSSKQKAGWPKAIVRAATEKMLPDQVRWRRPSPDNLNLHFLVNLLSSRPAWIADTLDNGLKDIAGYVNHAMLCNVLAKYQANPTHSETVWKIYQTLRLFFWLRKN